MAAGVELKESDRVSGIILDFSLSDDASSSPSPSSSLKVPRRVRQRLMESKTPSTITVEEIQTKLKEADQRRQQFHEWLSSKARPKPRSPSWSSSQEEDLGQRLEARLYAAEQKRLSILAKAQMRLARLDELRQAAKTEVEMRTEKEREELGTKVESRVQQAEANRMLLLKEHRQRRAAAKERRDRLLLQRMVQEKKYKECIHEAICQKRVAAEKKRLRLLEAEKTRTHARFMQVKRVAKLVHHQREIERRRLMDKLEHRLERARSQRAEYLRQRGSLQSSVRVNWYEMHKQGEILSKQLARCWRRFVRSKRTTMALAKEYDALEIKEKSVKSMPFDHLALQIESAATIQTVKALLDRFETRFKLSHVNGVSSSLSRADDIDHLLKRLSSPRRRGRPSKTNRGRGAKKVGTSGETAQIPNVLSRYPVRVILCAYMILGHPDAVFSGQGESEHSLAESAEHFIREFEMLIKVVLDGPTESVHEESNPTLPSRRTFRVQLEAFDTAWCSYLYCFVVWKVKDARSLEEDLVRAACQMEFSMMQKCKLTPEGDNVDLSHDMKAIQKQVTEDQRLLREKVQHLSGDAGIERMECALSDTRSRFFESKENGSPMTSPIAHILSPSPPGSSASPSSLSISDKGSSVPVAGERPRGVVRSLFKGSSVPVAGERPRGVVRSLFKDNSLPPKESVPSTSFKSNMDIQLGASDEKVVRENELLVNEIVHQHRYAFADSFNVNNEDLNDIQAKVKDTIENAFWDSIADSMRQDDPNYDRIVELMKEVRDELCEMAPKSWRQEILEAIDLGILSQVFMSGTNDMDYLGKILEFALVTLQKLSAPATEDEMKQTHKKLLNELGELSRAGDKSSASFVTATIGGLRFVLEQIQALKQEISKAHIRIIEPLIKGPAGLEYLKKAFSTHYGSPSDASTSLPLTKQWISSLQGSSTEQEWDEHKDSLYVLIGGHSSSSQGLPPATALRTGGVASKQSQLNSYSGTSITGKQPECKGEKVDVLVRLGLLKLVSGIVGITNETLPETLKLNFARLRGAQSQVQKIIVISTSLLVLRQTLLSQNLSTSHADLEYTMTNSFKGLIEFLDSAEDAGITQIVEKMNELSAGYGSIMDTEKLQARKEMMANLLLKSLQDGDAVFERVSRAVYLAVRGAILGGSGPEGRKLAETVLRRVGAALLIEKVMEVAEVLIVVAVVSGNVHGPWYAQLI